MIVTNNAVFLHIPKTGGTWVKEVLSSYQLDFREHSLDVPISHKDKSVFVFVRNPWAWHVSFYNYMKSIPHVNTISPGTSPHILSLIWKHIFHSNASFEEFIYKFYSPPTIEFKKKMNSLKRLRAIYLQIEHKDTKHLDIEKKIDIMGGLSPFKRSSTGIYQSFIDEYTALATQVGKTESIRADLKSMLASVDELTSDIEKKIDILAPANAGDPADYRKYYTAETQQLVAKSAESMIKRFNYDF